MDSMKIIKFADVNPGFHKGYLKISYMRNFIVLFAFLVLTPVTMLAQDKVEKPVEINVSYGGPHGTIGMDGGSPYNIFSNAGSEIYPCQVGQYRYCRWGT